MKLVVRSLYDNYDRYMEYIESGLNICEVHISPTKTIPLDLEVFGYPIGYLAEMTNIIWNNPIKMSITRLDNYYYIRRVASLYAIFSLYNENTDHNRNEYGESIHHAWCNVFYYYRIISPLEIHDDRSMIVRVNDIDDYNSHYYDLRRTQRKARLRIMQVFSCDKL